MKNILSFTALLLLCASFGIAQDQKIYVFDPNGVSANFQFTLSQLTDDSVFVADTIDDSIFSYDALFLFILTPALKQEESNRLIQYTSLNRPAYVYQGTLPFVSDSIAFWNHIGIEEIYGLLISVPIDTVIGVQGMFTQGLVIDTSFMSGIIPFIIGNVDSILLGKTDSYPINTTYVSGFDSLNVIIDLYNLIDNYGFLERVLQKFNLIPLNGNIDIQFYPQVDTAFVYGGCCTPQMIARKFSSISTRDSISIEPGFNTIFYYYDSSGTPVSVENFYFIVTDSLDEFDYELWYYQTGFNKPTQIIIPFDSAFHIDYHFYNIQLVVKRNGIIVGTFSQPFHADFGLSADDNKTILKEFYLNQNYPNPFNPTTVISWQAPVSGWQTLKVFDDLGNEIATLVNEYREAGRYKIEFDASSLASGVYIYKLTAGSFISSKKMMVIK
ncbi:T9SS type A sorting domain-containing protein [Ignavibacterium album]|uniref:T9SS type A sorting domain-containing protein n=1 Tax=Ignavibacterium album TaxID=591197 RepID=UPI0035B7F210